MKNADDNFIKKVFALLWIIFIIAIVIGIPGYVFFNNPEYREIFSSVDNFDAFLDRHQDTSIFIYLFCQIIQVVVTVIPGQVIQVSGGYAFTLPLALFLSLFGIFTGSAISFYIARILGRRAVDVIFGKEKTERYNRVFNTKKGFEVMFLLYLIPGLPKDVLPYFAGVSNMKFIPFMLLSLTGRLPAMMCSLVFGRMLRTRSYYGAIVLGVAIAAILIVCFIKREQISRKLNEYFEENEYDHLR